MKTFILRILALGFCFILLNEPILAQNRSEFGDGSTLGIQDEFLRVWQSKKSSEISAFYKRIEGQENLSEVLDLHIKNFPSHSSNKAQNLDHLGAILLNKGAQLIRPASAYLQYLDFPSRLPIDTVLMQALFDHGLAADFTTVNSHYTKYPGNLIGNDCAASVIYGVKAGGVYKETYSMDLTEYCFQSLFHWACHYGELKVVDFLLDFDPGVLSSPAWTPEGITSKEMYYENGLSTALRPKGERPVGSPVLKAGTLLSMAKKLDAAGADVLIPNYKGRTSLQMVEEYGDVDLKKYVQTWTNRQRTEKRKDEKSLMKLLKGKSGAELDTMKLYRKPLGEVIPLTYAVVYQMDDLIAQLLNQGASPFVKSYRYPFNFLTSPYRAAFLYEKEEQLLLMAQKITNPKERENLIRTHLNYLTPDYRLKSDSLGVHHYPLHRPVFEYLSQGLDSARIQSMIENKGPIMLSDSLFDYWLSKIPLRNRLALRMKRFHRLTYFPNMFKAIPERMIRNGLPLDEEKNRATLSVYRKLLKFGSPDLLKDMLERNSSILFQPVYIKEIDTLGYVNPLIEILPRAPGFAYSSWESMSNAPNYFGIRPEDVKRKIEILTSFEVKFDSPDFRNIGVKEFLAKTTQNRKIDWPKWLYELVNR